MRNNTIVTIGDVNYIWGIFMLIASARKVGMDEPFLVGARGFTPEAERVLKQLGDVTLFPLDDAELSLTCYKPYVMREAKTDFVTWSDSDAFFTGNVSELLPPQKKGEIHFRLRSVPEMSAAFRNHEYGEDGKSIPQAILKVWHDDILALAGAANEAARYATSGSGCFCSLALAGNRRFLDVWHDLQMKVLPRRNVGVADHSLPYYHQLDESTLNACLNFVVGAPRVQGVFKMDRDPSRLFVHFVAQPKPWVGWTRRALRHFDSYVSIVEWAEAEGLVLPGPVPFSLRRGNRTAARLLAPWTELKPKVMKRLRGGWKCRGNML